jgi:anaerobic magnesium-protoporphyrin IX monomethyl ester cyclase
VRVAFVYPDFFETQEIHTEPQGRVYLGIGYLSAFLKSGGHSVELIHLIKPVQREELVEKVTTAAPDLVAFSATTLQFAKVRTYSAWVKDCLGLPTICGGVHPTISPEETISEPGIDFICVGEGEEALLEFADAMEEGKAVHDIPNIWGKKDGHVWRNPVRPLIEELDALPFPDRFLFDPENFASNQRERLTMLASRGCPFECSYCCNHLQKTIYPNSKKYVRFRSPENVVREIEESTAADTGISQVRFDDDILTLDRGWFRRFASLYSERVGLPFICNARVDLLNEEMVDLLALAGCSAIAMGVESGNPWLRRNVLMRSMGDDKILKAFEMCRERGIPTVSLNMVGFPHETLKMALDTVKMNSRIKPGLAQVTALFPFPNTRIHQICLEGDMLGDASADTLFSGRSQLNLDKISREQVNMICENFVLLMVAYQWCGRLPRPLSGVAAKALDSFLTTRLIPDSLRNKILERRRYRLDWKYFIGVDY